MIRERAKWPLILIGSAVLFVTLYVLMYKSTQPSPQPSTVVAPLRPKVIAHRGGAGLWPENTLYAFERAVQLGVDVLEMDMHSTRDGVLVIIHDATVDRTTNGSGRVGDLTLAELKKLDAGYHWSPDGGKSFPLRGKGITVPTLSEVFEAFPTMRLNIDIKQAQPPIVKSFCGRIREVKMTGNVMVASFRVEALEEFRRECREVATSASIADLRAFMASKNSQTQTAPQLKALQVPEYAFGLQVLTREFVEAAHKQSLEVHVWTINDEAGMRRVMALGVDGVMTDYPDRLLGLLR
jgi:glycerophosphoryl diester phosphodiesterase